MSMRLGQEAYDALAVFFRESQQMKEYKTGSVKNVGVEDTPRISEPLSFFEKTLFLSAPTGVSHR